MIYEILSEGGQWEDSYSYSIGYFLDKEEALKSVKEINDRLRELKEINRKLENYDSRLEEEDGVRVKELDSLKMPYWMDEDYLSSLMAKQKVYDCNNTRKTGSYCYHCEWVDLRKPAFVCTFND